MAIATIYSFLILFLSASLLPSFPSADDSFDVRRHLSTVTRYDAGKGAGNDAFLSSSVPNGCRAIHLNLVARHGTRSPTKKRIKELDRLEIRLGALLKEAKQESDKSSLQKSPPWLEGWESPWKGREKGGELVSKGEDELYDLAIRVRERFPEIFHEEYHPEIFTIRATQVPRASASAVAFGFGLFHGKGSLGPGKHRAFSVISESRASDICLRFFDTCATYKAYRESQEPAVDKHKEPILDEVTSSLISRHHLNFTRQDVASLWFLCKQEASLLDITHQACGLFNETEVSLLEWTDDLEVFLLKGYGKAINYLMGIPLLQDIVQAMEQAIIAKEENWAPRTFEKARLRFAHAETVVPLTCLLGLFLEGSEFEQIQSEQPLHLPPKPPQKRNWMGSIVAPFAGNNILALFHCPLDGSDGATMSRGKNSTYYVQVLHNEIPVPMPGCGGSDFCPFEVFKEQIVNPHLKHDYHKVCNAKLELPGANLDVLKPCSVACKLLNLFRGLFLQKGSGAHPQYQKTEL